MAVRIVRYSAATEPKESKVRLVRRENAIRQNNAPLRNPVSTAAPRSTYTKPKSNGYVSVADLNRATNGSGVTPVAVTSPTVRAAVNRSRRNGGRAVGTDTHSKLLKTAMEKNQRESEKQARANERRGLLPRVGDTLLGGLKQRGGSLTNAAGTASDLVGGTAMNTVYREQTEMLDRQIAALNDVLSDPALPERERSETKDALRTAKNRRGLYGDALRANKGTAQKLYEAADALTQSGARDMERAKAGLNGAERAGIDVLAQGEQILLDKALGGVTGLGALTHMAARSFGSGAQQARQEGASPQHAALYGAADALKETATEKLFDGLGGVYGKGAADKAAQKAIKRLTNSETTERLLRVAASALEESGEELLGGVAAPPLQSLYNGRSVAQNYRDMKPGDVLYDALIGGILGAAGGSVDVTRDAVRANPPRNMTREIPLRTAARDGRMDIERPAAESKASKTERENSRGEEQSEHPLKRTDNSRARPTLSDKEKAAVLAYKSSESYKINAALRGERRLTAAEQTIVEGLDSALEKLPESKGTFYRNLCFDDFGEEAYLDFLASYKVGRPVQHPSYISTSKATDGHPLDGKYIVNMEIEGIGNELAGYGNNSEREVLFKRDVIFIPTKITRGKDGHILIKLKEVAADDKGLE